MPPLGQSGAGTLGWLMSFVEGSDTLTAPAGVDGSAQQGQVTWRQRCCVGASVCPILAVGVWAGLRLAGRWLISAFTSLCCPW